MRQAPLGRRVLKQLLLILAFCHILILSVWMSVQRPESLETDQLRARLRQAHPLHEQHGTDAVPDARTLSNTKPLKDHKIDSQALAKLTKRFDLVADRFSSVRSDRPEIAGGNSLVVTDTDARTRRSNVSAGEMLRLFLDSDQLSALGVPEFSCLGWRDNGGCTLAAPSDLIICNTSIKAGASGYCLLRNEATGEEVRAMQVNCSSLRSEVEFDCEQAADFALATTQLNMLIDTMKTEPNQPQVQGSTEPKSGVLMVIYPKLLSSVYATIRVLRWYNCSLPVELWFLENEMGSNPLADNRLLQSLENEYGPISLHGISGGKVDGFNTKIFALAHSNLDQVLFLDADNTPVKDPTYLFTASEFVETGTIFWPDFWHPANTIFNLHNETLLWELVDTPFVDMFEQESGQLLIDRRRTAAALSVLQFLALRQPNPLQQLKLVHGDKDLFRLAWLKTNTSFHMIETPAAVAGMLNNGAFCGITMAQHDPEGEVLFLHHNGKKVIDNDRTRTWTHLQSFVFPDQLALHRSNASDRYSYLADNYRVDSRPSAIA